MKLKILTFSILIGSIVAMGYVSAFKINSALAQELGYKIFISPQYKFSIEYPDDLHAHDYTNGSESGTISFDFFDTSLSDFASEHSEVSLLFIAPNNITLQQYIDHKMTKEFSGTQILQKPTPIKIDGNPGLSFSKVDRFKTMTKEVVFSHGDNIFEFNYIVDKTDFNEDKYNHMIESIKFLD